MGLYTVTMVTMHKQGSYSLDFFFVKCREYVWPHRFSKIIDICPISIWEDILTTVLIVILSVHTKARFTQKRLSKITGKISDDFVISSNLSLQWQ